MLDNQSMHSSNSGLQRDFTGHAHQHAQVAAYSGKVDTVLVLLVVAYQNMLGILAQKLCISDVCNNSSQTSDSVWSDVSVSQFWFSFGTGTSLSNGSAVV